MENVPEVFLKELNERLDIGVEKGNITPEQRDEFRDAYVMAYLGRIARIGLDKED